MNWEKVKALLESANLSDEQVKALDTFFSEYTEEVRKNERANLKPLNENEEEMISKKDAEKAFAKFQEDAETAFMLFKEDSENAFNLFKKDAQKAFDLYAEDLQSQYTENMIAGLQDLYEDIEERVKRDFFESKDAAVLSQIKKAVAPLVVAEDQQALLEEIEKLKAEKQQVLNETQELSKENIINSLIADFPKEYQEEIKGYLENAKDHDDIYERFSFICEMIDKDDFNLKSKTEINEEKKKEIKKETKIEKKKEIKKEEEKKENKSKIKSKKIITEELNQVSSVSSKSKEAPVVKKDKFTSEDDALISLIFN